MIQEITNYIRQSLADCYPASEVKALAKIILTEVLHLSTTDIYAGKDIKLSAKETEELKRIVARLRNYEPIQYILGYTHFYGLCLEVTPDTLIPRPETEELVDLIVRENPSSSLRILDVGSGSGCISLALAAHLKASKVTAWDVSAGALQVARRNAEALRLSVEFEQRDVLTYLPCADGVFDIIVSNPPYIIESEKAEMEANVLEWEPDGALFVPDDDPLLFYRHISELALTLLTPSGRLYFEINRRYGRATKLMMESLGYHDVTIVKDMAGLDRIVKAKR